MRRRSQEIALPPLMDTQAAPLRLRRRLPVRRVAKATGWLVYEIVLGALLLLAGFAAMRAACPEDTCGGPDVAASKGPP